MALPNPENYRRSVLQSQKSGTASPLSTLPNPENFRRSKIQGGTAAIGAGTLTQTQRNAMDHYKSAIGDYNWLSDYDYDLFSDEDVARKTKGEMPSSVYGKYNMEDPVDVALYKAGLPPRAYLKSATENAAKWRQEQEEMNQPLMERDERNLFERFRDLSKGTEPAVPGATLPAQQTAISGNKTVDELVDLLFVDNTPAKQAAAATETLVPQRQSPGGWYGRFWASAEDQAKNDETLSWLLDISKAESEVRRNANYRDPVIEMLEAQYKNDPTFSGEPEITYTNQMGYMTPRETKSAERVAAENAFDEMQENLWLDAAGAPEGVSRYSYEPLIEARRLSLVEKQPDFAQVTADPFTAGEIIGADTHTSEKTRRLADAYNASADNMTDAEKSVFAYHVRTGDTLEKAQNYLEAITPELDLRQSVKIAAHHADNKTLGSIMTAAVAGLENGIMGLKRIFNPKNNALRSEGAWGPAYAELRQETAGIFGLVSDALYMVGRMAPSIAAGTITGNLVVGAATMGAGVVGNGFEEIKKAGGTDEEAALFGILTGLSEATLQYFLGGIAKLGKNVAGGKVVQAVTGALSKVFKNPTVTKLLESTAGRWVAGKAGSAAGEALEEYLQDAVIEPVIRRVALNEDAQIDLLSPEALYSALLGAVTSVVMPGGGESNVEDPSAIRLRQGDYEIGDANEVSGTEIPALAEPLQVNQTDAKGITAETFDAGRQAAFDEYVENAWLDNKKNQAPFIFFPASQKLVDTINTVYGTDLAGYVSLVTDNDLRHIKNSHGINNDAYVAKNNKSDPYGINAGDLQAIPYILTKFDDVYLVKREDGKSGLVYVVNDVDSTYYLESVIGDGTLSGKQMIKTSKGSIPSIEGLAEAIKERGSTSPAPDDSGLYPAHNPVPGMYVQDVWTDASPNTIPQTETVFKDPLIETAESISRGRGLPDDYTDVLIDTIAPARNADTNSSAVDPSVETDPSIASLHESIDSRAAAYPREYVNPFEASLLESVDSQATTGTDPLFFDADADFSNDPIIAPLEAQITGQEVPAGIAEQANAEETVQQIKTRTEQITAAQKETGTGTLSFEEAMEVAGLPPQLRDRVGRKKKKSADDRISYHQTPSQNFDAVSNGKKDARNSLFRLLELPWIKAKRFVSRKTKEFTAAHIGKLQELGLTQKDTWGAQWYGEGQKAVNADGTRVLDENGKPTVIQYTLDDLKTDFPDKWEALVEMDAWYRENYEKLYQDLDAGLKRIYPNEEARVQKELSKWADRMEGLKSKARNAQARAQALSKVLETDIRVLAAADQETASKASTLQKEITNKELLIQELQTKSLQLTDKADGKKHKDTKVYENLQNQIFRLEEQISRERTALEVLTESLTQKVDKLHGQKNYAELRNKIDRTQQALEKAKDEAAQAWGAVRTTQIEYDAYLEDVKSGKVYGTKRMRRRENYYHHAMKQRTGFGGFVDAMNRDASIDPMLEGTSEYTKPKSMFAGFMKEREGVNQELSPAEAFEVYAEKALKKIAFDPVIARIREVNQIFREVSGQPKKNADGQFSDEKEITGPNNRLIGWLDDWANQLAGKTNPFDRPTSKEASRKSLLLLKCFNSRVKANAVGGNVRSALAQFFNIPNATMFVKNPKYWERGARAMFLHMSGKSEVMQSIYEQSDFLSGRTLNRELRKIRRGTEFADGKIKNATNALIEAGDIFSAQLMWWAAYEMGSAELDAINSSKLYDRTFESAVDFADYVAREASAGREAGDVPIKQDAVKTGVWHPFQVEINNQMQIVKGRAMKSDWGALIAFLIATWLMNEGAEKLTGDRIGGFDFINALVDVVQTVQSEDWKDLPTSDKIAGTGGRLIGELLNSVPYGATITSVIAGGDPNLSKKVFGDENPTRFGTGPVGITALGKTIFNLATGKQGDYWEDILFNFVTPYGGRQMSRALDTLENMGAVPSFSYGINDGFTSTNADKAPTSYTNSGQVRFAADTDPLSIIQSMLLGQYSTASGREYIESGAKPLSDKQTGVYERLVSEGTDAHRAEDTLRFLMDIDGGVNVQRHHLFHNDDLTSTEKQTISGDLLDEGKYIDYFNGEAAFELSLISAETYQKSVKARSEGITYEQYLDYYEYVKDLRTAKNLHPTTLMGYLNSTDLNERQKKYLYESTNNYKWDNRPR